MRKTTIFFGLILSALVLAGAGCQIGPFSFGKSGATGNDGGIYKSQDKADTWAQKTQILAVAGAIKNFGNINIISFAFDPSDHNAIYAGSAGNGLFYSYDAGASWQQPTQITAGAIRSIAIDPKNKCVIYLAVGNQILKSVDCNRNFVSIYQETRVDVALNQIVIDSYNSANLFLGNSAGDLLKSSDGGKSWVVIRHFDNAIAKMVMNPLDMRKIYVATQDYGIFRTGDSGASWVDLNQGLKQYGGAFVFRDLILMDAKAESLLLSSQYGLIKSGDGGVSWTALQLLTPPSGADIKVVAVNPQNPKEIFYATPSTFYKSFDGGVKWTTKKLPSTRQPTVLINDPVEPKVMYTAFLKVAK
ncbi:MAG: hypothetical protein HZC05_00555 [Candidatus Magasanikbacteria bacterium]|nr:hypothetical protein [Candidatus Magasanikbacteria bacterium]